MDKQEIKKQEKITVTGKKNNFKLHDLLIANFKSAVMLIFAIILAGGYFLALQPKFIAIKKEKSLISEKEAEISSLNSKIRQLEKMKDSYEEIDKIDLDKIDSILPDVLGKDKLLSEIESLILKNGLLLTSLQIEEVKEVKKVISPEGETSANLPGTAAQEKKNKLTNVGKIKINVDLAGTNYDNFKKILKAIEDNLRLLDIAKIQFNPDANKTSLEIFAYYLIKK